MRLQLKVIIFVGLIYIITSCKALWESNNQESSELSIENTQAIPQIFTLIFEINSDNSVQLTSSTLNQGKLRQTNTNKNHTQNEDLIISFLDVGKNVCKTLSIDNPLKKKIEYSNDFRELQAKIVELDNAPFSIRIQYKECMKYILIERIIDNSNRTYETLIEIPVKISNPYE